MFQQPKSWPDLIGKDANEAQQKLLAEGYQPVILPQGSPCTRDYRIERVRLFVDSKNEIVEEPRTG